MNQKVVKISSVLHQRFMADIFPMWKSRSHRGENSTRRKQCFNLFGNAGQLGTITRKQIESKYSPKKVTNVKSAFRRIVPTWFGHVVRSRGPRVSQCLIINFVFFFRSHYSRQPPACRQTALLSRGVTFYLPWCNSAAGGTASTGRTEKFS